MPFSVQKERVSNCLFVLFPEIVEINYIVIFCYSVIVIETYIIFTIPIDERSVRE